MPLSKPQKSAGLTLPEPERIAPRELKDKYEDLEDSKSYFTVSYFEDGTGKSKVFHFAMLPAIEAQLQFSSGGSLKGQGSVPEVKPGILTNTTVKYKNFLVPGGSPVVQTIGIQQTTHQLVGAFIGSEAFKDKGGAYTKDLNPIYRIDNGKLGSAPHLAKEFDEKVVQSGRPVNIEIQSDVKYFYEGVIVSFKFYAVRQDRAYYVLDLLATRYRGKGTAKVDKEAKPTTSSN